MELEWILAYLLLGAVVGLLAGLFGIGGGGIMVPVFTTLFTMQEFNSDQVVHVALATSMAAIMVTSLSSLRAHHSHGSVLWKVVWRMAPGILLGTFGAAQIASLISSRALSLFFAIFMGWVALRMMTRSRPNPSRELPGGPGLALAGTGIGSVSALVAIGGGSLTVPFLTWCNVSIQRAIGTSAAVGFPIAVAGTAGYLISGWGAIPGSGMFGFINLPAAAIVSVISYSVAPLGARLAHRLPVNTLSRLFAALLIFLSLHMLYVVYAA